MNRIPCIKAIRYCLPLLAVAIAPTSEARSLHRSFVGGYPAEVVKAHEEAHGNDGNTIIGNVMKVSDGDTIWVVASGGKRVKVRLDRIDAPESGQKCGKKAAMKLSDKIYGKKVTVKYQKCDQYGRVLGVVYLDGEDINLWMVREGAAWHYSYYDQTPAYSDAEKEARMAKKGLWVETNPVNPYEWRKMKKGKR